MRKLASVVRVASLSPIPNADKIEVARLEGSAWQCVVKRGEFSVGDLAVYLEIDCVPPDDARFSWLWMKEGAAVPRPEKFRIRTLKLRGVLSQGLLMPLAQALPGDVGDVVEGLDVTSRLGITKYDPPLPTTMSGDIRAGWIAPCPKTDESRIQTAAHLMEALVGKPFAITLKCDGTSATYLMHEGELHACSRNHSVKPGGSVYWRIAESLGLEAKLRARPELVVQGEVVGPGIQGNKLGLKGPELRVFTIYDTSRAAFVPHRELVSLCAALQLPMVDVLEEGDAFPPLTVDALLAKAEGKYPGTSNEREGIVVRPRDEEVLLETGERLSFKAISNRFLLKEAD